MVKIRNGNPVIASALICAALFYSNLVRPKKAHPYKSLVPKSEIAIATGTICSNPVKSSSGGTYRADFFLESVTSKTGETSESRGILPILIPAELVEAFFPGKLYTRTGGARGIVAENGARLKIGGQTFQSQKSGQDCFSVSWANPLGWESSLAKVRGQLRLQFKRLMHSWGNAGGLLLALLSGSREYTEKQVSEAFTGAGLSH
ncbi:MAG: hypothetical protein II921_09245, partial [Treponema sp.]|nr:hypothetical protein [Treponema sp.]